jgi:hypothetical protein
VGSFAAGADAAFEARFGAEYRRVRSTPDRADDGQLARRLSDAVGAADAEPEMIRLLCERIWALVEGVPTADAVAVEALARCAATVPDAKRSCLGQIIDLRLAAYRRTRDRRRRRELVRALAGRLTELGELEAAAGNFDAAVPPLRRAVGRVPEVVPDRAPARLPRSLLRRFSARSQRLVNRRVDAQQARETEVVEDRLPDLAVHTGEPELAARVDEVLPQLEQQLQTRTADVLDAAEVEHE